MLKKITVRRRDYYVLGEYNGAVENIYALRNNIGGKLHILLQKKFCVWYPLIEDWTYDPDQQQAPVLYKDGLITLGKTAVLIPCFLSEKHCDIYIKGEILLHDNLELLQDIDAMVKDLETWGK